MLLYTYKTYLPPEEDATEVPIHVADG
jgi:hypothetical protein